MAVRGRSTLTRRLWSICRGIVGHGVVQQLSHTGVHSAANHVAALGHAHLAWPKWSAPMRANSPPPSMSVATVLRKVGADIGHPEFGARCTPLAGEIVRVTQRARGGRVCGVAEAARLGPRELLVALRDRIAGEIDAGVLAWDLATLSRSLVGIAGEVELLDTAADGIAVAARTPDEAWSGE